MDKDPKQAAKLTPADKKWYIIKVQSNREDTVAERLRKQAQIAGLEEWFGQILVPYEKVTELSHGKKRVKRVVKRKLYPGYILVEMVITDETWFLCRELPGIGDFAGAAGKAIPMEQSEIDAILAHEKEQNVENPGLVIPFAIGDHVKIKDGTFVNQEGEVDKIDTKKGLVTVLINTFGRTTPFEIDYLQIEKI